MPHSWPSRTLGRADQDRCEGDLARQVRDVPDGGVRRAAWVVRSDPGADPVVWRAGLLAPREWASRRNDRSDDWRTGGLRRNGQEPSSPRWKEQDWYDGRGKEAGFMVRYVISAWVEQPVLVGYSQRVGDWEMPAGTIRACSRSSQRRSCTSSRLGRLAGRVRRRMPLTIGPALLSSDEV